MKNKITIKSEINRELNSKESGVTLLLTLLILGSIMIIVFSVATITFNEIKTSGDLGRSEPAIAAAEGSTEDFLYSAVRGLGSLPGCSSPAVDNSFTNNVTTSTCADYYFPNPYNFNIPAPTGGSPSEQDFYLYNPADQTANPGYTGLTVTMNSGNLVDLWICPFSSSNCTGNPPIVLSQGSPTYNTNTLDPTSKYTIILQVQVGQPDANLNISGNPQGIPSGVTTIKSTGSSRGTTRKLETTVPQ